MIAIQIQKKKDLMNAKTAATRIRHVYPALSAAVSSVVHVGTVPVYALVHITKTEEFFRGQRRAWKKHY